MTRFHILTLLSTVTLFAVTGCGPGVNHSGMNGQNSGLAAQADGQGTTQADDGLTGGFTPSGTPYTTISSDQEIKTIKDKVPVTPENQAFASQIESTDVDFLSGTPQVQVQLQGASAPLVFKGSLTPNTDNSEYVGQMTDSTRPDLQIAATCKDKDCSDGDYLLQDASGHEAGIHVKKEEGTMHLIVPTDETKQEMKDSGLDSYSQDRQVEYTYVETFPGKTLLSVKDKKTGKDLNVNVTETDSDAVPTSDSHTELYGASSDELVFRVTRSIKNPKSKEKTAVAYLEIKPKNPAPVVNPEVPGQCAVRISGQVNPLVKFFLKDCSRPEIVKNTKKWASTSKLEKFLKISDQSKLPSPPSGQPLDFKKMIEVLRQGGLPDVWSLVTLEESNFKNNLTGKAGEKGVWQIKASTAVALKLPVSERVEIVPSTRAVVNYYKGFLSRWNNDPEMALAAYNRGEGGVQGSMGKSSNPLAAQHNLPTDLWTMCKITRDRALKLHTCDYVQRIIAAMTVSLDPQAYGVSEVGPMEGK